MTEETSKLKHSPAEIAAGTQHYTAVGLVAGTWAAFELQLDSHALELAKIPTNAGNCFTAQILGSANKLNAYMAVAQLRGAKRHVGELETFAKDTVGLSEQRNRVVHDTWMLDGMTPFRFEVTAKRKLRRLRVATPTAEVEKLSITIGMHINRFLALHERIAAEVGA